jgi:hypothetical protein
MGRAVPFGLTPSPILSPVKTGSEIVAADHRGLTPTAHTKWRPSGSK